MSDGEGIGGVQHGLLVKEEREDCALVATRLAAIVKVWPLWQC